MNLCISRESTSLLPVYGGSFEAREQMIFSSSNVECDSAPSDRRNAVAVHPDPQPGNGLNLKDLFLKMADSFLFTSGKGDKYSNLIPLGTDAYSGMPLIRHFQDLGSIVFDFLKSG